MADGKIKMAMVGGGLDSFNGRVHIAAAALDGRIELVGGSFSNSRRKPEETGEAYKVAPDRSYATYRDMLRREARFPQDERIDFVTIATPNNMHYPVAMAALDSGFDVFCDRPMTLNLDEARNLARKLDQTGRLFCLAQNLCGYAMVRKARELIADGALGRMRRVTIEEPQSWLATRRETAGNKQAMWRTDPRRAGLSCCMEDVGSHCEFLATYVTGDSITEVCADMKSFVNGRPLDDDGSVLIRFDSGATGVIWCSQVAIGEELALRARFYGEFGALEWNIASPFKLVFKRLNKPVEVFEERPASLVKLSDDNGILPRPEGIVESFAALYSAFADALLARRADANARPARNSFPQLKQGLQGVAFLEAIVVNSRSKEKWTRLPIRG